MTLFNQTRVITYIGNSAATVFPFNFPIYETAHIDLRLYDRVTNDYVSIHETDYTSTGVGPDSTGGTITYNPGGVPIPSTKMLAIYRTLPYTQQADIRNQSGFYPEVIEQQLDEIVMQIQQIGEGLNRAIILPPTSSLNVEEFIALLLALGENLDSVITVGNNIADVITVAGNSADISTVADNLAAILQAPVDAAAAAAEAEAAAAAAQAAQAAAEAAAASAVGTPQVATIADLKQLDTTKYQLAYLTGAGREGIFMWRTGNYSTQITADPQNGVYVKANAVAATSGAWVRSSNNKPNPFWFGASYVGAADTAFGAFFDYIIAFELEGELPAGRFSLNAAISKNAGTKKFGLIGQGRGISELYFPTSSGGLGFTHTLRSGESSTEAALRMKDFSLITGWQSGQALSITCSPTIPSCTSKGSIVENIECRGLDPASQNWSDGIVLTDEWNSIVTDCNIKGRDDAFDPFDMSNAILLTRCNDCQVNRNYIYHCDYAIRVATSTPSYGDGCTIVDNRIVGVSYGVFIDGTVTTAHCSISGNHINAYRAGIVLNNVCYTAVTNNLIFKTHLSTFNNWPGIQLSGTTCNDNVIQGNNIATPGADGTGITDFGIFLSGFRNKIIGNAFTNTVGTFYGVYINTGADYNVISLNTFDNTVNVPVGGGATANNIVDNNVVTP